MVSKDSTSFGPADYMIMMAFPKVEGYAKTLKEIAVALQNTHQVKYFTKNHTFFNNAPKREVQPEHILDLLKDLGYNRNQPNRIWQWNELYDFEKNVIEAYSSGNDRERRWAKDVLFSVAING